MSVIVKEVTAVAGQITTVNRKTRSFCTFNWLIPHFSQICPSQTTTHFQMLKSPTFIAGEDVGKESEWGVILWGIDGYLAINLQLSPKSPLNHLHLTRGIHCKFTVSLGSRDDRFDKMSTTEHRFEGQSDRWGYIRFLEISELFQLSDIFLEDGTLRICVQMEIDQELNFEEPPIQNKEESSSQLEKLSLDLERLYEDPFGAFWDLKVQCGGRVFYCHKNVLTARSRVFGSIIKSQIVESINEIVIDDLLPSTMSALLNYIYTGRVDISVSDYSSWTALIRGAAKYDLPYLKSLCFDEMLGGLCEGNVVTLIMAGHLYGVEERIKRMVHQFCLEHLETLILDPKFKDLMTKYPEAFISL